MSIRGKSFAFTGKIPGWPRSEIARYTRSRGANVHASVRRDTDFLVVGETRTYSSKEMKADQYRTTKLSEQNFFSMANEKYGSISNEYGTLEDVLVDGESVLAQPDKKQVSAAIEAADNQWEDIDI